MKKVILNIDGMSCSACSNGLEKYLRKQDGIISANVNLVLAQASIEYSEKITIKDLERFIKEAGFKSLGEFNINRRNDKKSKKILLIIFSILSLIVLYISMGSMIGIPSMSFIDMEMNPVNYCVCLLFFSVLFMIYGFHIFKDGYNSLIHKSPSMDTLVSIGVLSSFIYSLICTIMVIKGKVMYVHNIYFESCALVIYFVKLGRFIDEKNKDKTKEAISELASITPEFAFIKINNEIKKVTIDEVKKGDIIVCKSGSKVAVDGKVVSGSAYFDESFITGESNPVKKEKNNSVIAGSINMSGYIEYEAIRIGRDSTISEIVKLVSEASNTKAPIAKIADRVCGYFTPFIMLVAFLTLFTYLLIGYSISESIIYFVNVLVVACPCALGLATPLAIVISEGNCAKNGVLIKSSEILENASKIDTIVFDKTGTLTNGKLNVNKIYNYCKYNEKEIIKIISSLESKSDHPIANAFNSKNIYDVSDFKNIDGIGISGKINNKIYYACNNKILSKLNIENIYISDEKDLSKNGNSLIYLVENKKVIALIGVRDTLRDNAKSVVEYLKNRKINVIMLSGDNVNSAKVIAREVGIDEVIADVMPKDKSFVIKKLIDSGNNVMMVGDGINDAPSLAISNIGVSISSGTDIANNSSDVMLINDNLSGIINLINISSKTIKNIKQNLFWAFFYNICMIPIAVGALNKFGIILNPMIGSFAMMLSSITVTMNALRLKNVKIRR